MEKVRVHGGFWPEVAFSTPSINVHFGGQSEQQMEGLQPGAPLQSRCALRIWDLPAIERANAIALLSIRMKRCATNDAWADAGCITIKSVTCLADIFTRGGGGERSL